MTIDEACEELESAVGPENVSREPAVLDGYAWQAFTEVVGQTSGWCPDRPAAVVLPGNTEEVREVVRICGRHGLRFKAMCTGWGVWNMVSGDDVVQVDLRRMDRILDIDEKNMYAVVEPYVIGAQLQAEAMKRGLNCHIIGAGSGTSPLASATSLCGYGWSGLTTSYSARNLLATEWVLPDGELLRLGTLGSGCGWFSGDGPGPSLRGVARGYIGNCGGLGVFTACALKLFPWPGPPAPEVEGLLMDAAAEVPETSKLFICAFPSFEAFAEATYKIGNAEIGYLHCKNAVGAFLSTMTPRLMDKIVAHPALKAALRSQQHMFQFLIAASSPRESAYQEKVLRLIVRETGGLCLDLSSMPSLHASLWWGFVRASLPPLIFRRGGSFGTSFGALEAWDHPVLQARVAAELKQSFIDQGKLIDDLADNAWGGIYEGSTCFGHQEELYLYDPRDPDMMASATQYLAETFMATVGHNLGPGLGFALGSIGAELFGPIIGDYHHRLREVKQAFDPDDVSDAGFYISLDPVGTIREAIARSPEMAAFLAARMRELGMDDEETKG
ncbi:MAG: FAD-binding oxidoreductase [Actinobacteria bacterium]|nr:FAD-binding oxidoreductase [Actinomycetota bacterium]